MGSALFADGAAAAIVTARNSPDAPALLQLDHFETVLTPVGEESMAWNIGDHGFEMVLGNYVPHIIDDHIIGALEPLLSRDRITARSPLPGYSPLGHPPRRTEHPGQGPIPA